MKSIAFMLWMVVTLGVQMEIHKFANTLPMSGVLTILIVVAFFYIYRFVQTWVKAQ